MQGTEWHPRRAVEQAGYLIDARAYCFGCAALRNVAAIPIYAEYIYPHKQECADCGELLVKGQTEASPNRYGGTK